jgi:two-component system, CitB family, sensor kinase
LLGSFLIGRRMRRLTHGLDAEELGLMHSYYDAVLHSVREGLLLLDNAGRVQSMNDEALRLLGIDGDPTGRPVSELGLPADLTAALVGPEARVDAVHLAKDRVLVVSALPALDPSAAHHRRSALGRAITMRDHTEMTELTNELGSSRDLTEALRSQAHESANRMHAVITLVELGRYEEAISFATEELRAAQHLTDQVVGAISEPVIAAVLLGKAQVAAERGIDFVVTPDSGLDADALIDAEISAREMLTVIGNLVDNAIDAVADSAVRKVSVTVRRTDPEADAILVEVADTGPGLDEESALLAFRRGWSTKTDTTVHGHGLGLGLVGQIVQRHGGSIIVEQSGGAVFRVEIGAGLRTRAASSASAPE